MFFEKLRETDKTYQCDCSRKFLVENTKKGRDGFIYPGFCRKKELRDMRVFATRLKVNELPIVFDDNIQGKLIQNLSEDIGDFVIKKNDGQFSSIFSLY